MYMCANNVLKFDIPTVNGHIYSRSVLERAVTEYQKQIESNKAFGTLFFEGTMDTVIKFECVSHRVVNLVVSSEGIDVCIEILDTPRGQILRNLSDQIELELFSSGIGNVSDNMIGDDFQITGFHVNFYSGGSILRVCEYSLPGGNVSKISKKCPPF